MNPQPHGFDTCIDDQILVRTITQGTWPSKITSPTPGQYKAASLSSQHHRLIRNVLSDLVCPEGRHQIRLLEVWSLLGRFAPLFSL